MWLHTITTTITILSLRSSDYMMIHTEVLTEVTEGSTEGISEMEAEDALE